MKKFEPPVCEMILFGAGDVLTKSNLDGDSSSVDPTVDLEEENQQ